MYALPQQSFAERCAIFSIINVDESWPTYGLRVTARASRWDVGTERLRRPKLLLEIVG